MPITVIAYIYAAHWTHPTATSSLSIMDRLMNFISLTKLIISAFAYSLLIEVVSITIVHYVMLSYGYPWRQTWSWDLLDIYPGDSPGFAHMLSPCITVVEGDVDICELKRFEGSSTAESRSKALLVGLSVVYEASILTYFISRLVFAILDLVCFPRPIWMSTGSLIC